MLDIRIPYLDGIQVMDQLAGAIEDDYLPVLVLTVEKNTETMVRALEKGAKDFVSKPFNRDEALSHIANMLEIRQPLQRAATTERGSGKEGARAH